MKQLEPADWWRKDPFDEFVLTERADSWDHFLGWLNELPGSWGFRGQREAEWGLHTSLDRAVRVEYSSKNSSGSYHLDRENEERDFLFRFQQQAHHYLHHLPSNDDLSSWFALMQHHGVPTRFLDWTQSPYVAMYFAVEEEPRNVRCSAVWAIDLDWLEEKGHELLQSEARSMPKDLKASGEYQNRILGHTDKPVIVRINPLRATERMAAQQGFFLCKLYHQASFDQILMSTMIHPETPDDPVIRRLTVDKEHRVEFLKNLRAMNIHRASLFPGLDGFSQSLRLDLEIKVIDEGKQAAAAAAKEPSIKDLQKMLEG